MAVYRRRELVSEFCDMNNAHTLYRAECDVADDVVAGVATVDHTLNLRVPESHCSRRETVGDVRLNAFVITYVTASSPNQQRYRCRCATNS